MNTNKKFRNPFPKIGMVMKYEFKHSVRKLLPLYGVIIAISIVLGIVAGTVDNFMYGQGIVLIIFPITISLVMTWSILSARFKTGLYGDESYVNLSFPVTMGEHLWGRFFTCFIWFIVCYLVVTLASFLYIIPYLIKDGSVVVRREANDLFSFLGNGSTVERIVTGIINGLAWITVAICFMFLMHSVSGLVSKNKGLVEFAVFVGIIIFSSAFAKIKIYWVAILCMFLRSALYFGLSHLILSKKMELE